MARHGLNKVLLIGNLGNDPEVHTFDNGTVKATISVATSESWKDKQTGEDRERTEWHRVVLQDRGNYHLGQIASEYLRKGSKVYIEGQLQTRKWTDRGGTDHYTTEIVASEMQMLNRVGEHTTTNQGSNTLDQQQESFDDGDIPF